VLRECSDTFRILMEARLVRYASARELILVRIIA
jgi:hypothetical protein